MAVALVAAGCGSESSGGDDAAVRADPETVAQQFVAGVLAADPETCSLMSASAVEQAVTITRSDDCGDALADAALPAALFRTDDGAAIEAAAEQGEVIEKGGGERFAFRLPNGTSIAIDVSEAGEGWQVDVVRWSKGELIVGGGGSPGS